MTQDVPITKCHSRLSSISWITVVIHGLLVRAPPAVLRLPADARRPAWFEQFLADRGPQTLGAHLKAYRQLRRSPRCWPATPPTWYSYR